MSLFCGMSQKKWSVKLDLNVMYILSAYFVTLEVEVREDVLSIGRSFFMLFSMKVNFLSIQTIRLYPSIFHQMLLSYVQVSFVVCELEIS